MSDMSYKVSKGVYKINAGENEDFAWMCRFCKVGLPNLIKITRTLEEMNTSNEKRIEMLEESMTNVETKMEDRGETQGERGIVDKVVSKIQGKLQKKWMMQVRRWGR